MGNPLTLTFLLKPSNYYDFCYLICSNYHLSEFGVKINRWKASHDPYVQILALIEVNTTSIVLLSHLSSFFNRMIIWSF
jgi:hypothetical protein